MENPYSRYQYEEKIRMALDPDERILWSGTGSTKWIVLATIPQALFAIPWTAFAIFWTVTTTGMRDGFKNGFQWFGLFGLIFVVVGFGTLLSPLRAWAKSKRMFYVLTNRRAIIAMMGRRFSMDSYNLNEAVGMKVRTRSDGSGDIIFGSRISKFGQEGTFGFMGIPGVENVERLIRSARENKPESPSQDW